MENENMSLEALYLATEAELLEEAAQIAKDTIGDSKFDFYLQYDANQKEYLLSILQTAGVIVTEEGDEGHTFTTQMNMRQLAFIKCLDCVERVKTDEGLNTFLAEEAEVMEPIQEDQQTEEASVEPSTLAMMSSNNTVVATEAERISEASAKAVLAVTTIMDEQMQDSEVAVASVTASAESSCCTAPTNTSMETAKEISEESYTSGNICCPCAEQWFKFTASRTGRYTIYTTGSLDTIGTLYDCCGNQIVEVDDYEPCGKLNFRIIKKLIADSTYYVKVRVCGNTTGSYTLRVTKTVLANYVNINKDTITLEKGVLYELPITPNYTYKGYNGAQRISDLSVSINPSSADEQKIWWYKSGNILNVSQGWDNDGNRFAHLTASGSGTAKLYAEDWNENGKRGECTVVVDSREQIIVKRDGAFNKIVFGNSGKTWYCLNFDHVNDYDTLNTDELRTIRDRLYRSTYTTVNWDNGFPVTTGVKLYSEKEMKLLYILDPLGFASYVQEYAKHVYSDVSDIVNFKNLVFVTLFGRDPKYYARTTDGDWYDATSQKDSLSIQKMLSEAELLFGTHQIYDYTTVRGIFTVVLQILALPVSLAQLAGVPVPIAYKVFLKCMNLMFSIWQADVENDFEKYIKAIKTATESESETKSADYELDWAKQLFKISDSCEELAENLADRPSFYREMFDLCAANEDYRIIFEYNNGAMEDASSISDKLNQSD